MTLPAAENGQPRFRTRCSAMAKEIERKFLLRDTRILDNLTGEYVVQAYLSSKPEATVRVRIIDSAAWLTVKGKNQGATRTEYEFRIPLADAREMLALCEPGRIEKRRYRIAHGLHIWEVDVFKGENEGLVVAEVELRNEREAPQIPDWIGEEVTGDPRYYNSALSRRPYSRWGAQADTLS